MSLTGSHLIQELVITADPSSVYLSEDEIEAIDLESAARNATSLTQVDSIQSQIQIQFHVLKQQEKDGFEVVDFKALRSSLNK